MAAVQFSEADVLQQSRARSRFGGGIRSAVGYGIRGGLGPADLLRLGNAAGAFVASSLACSDAMPRPSELERFINTPPHPVTALADG